MGKKDKKDTAKADAKKARQAAKQVKATSKRTKKEAKELGEDDIDTILAEFAKKDAIRTAVTITHRTVLNPVTNKMEPEPPSPRSNFSLTSLPNGDMIMFGGEFCDGERTTVYNELLIWNIEKNEWRQVESINTPSPRCSHQAVVYKDKLYIFGGEYATLDQFHHYKDLWALDLKTYAWTELKPNGTDMPSARSGHRMVLWKSYIVLFGGFYEAMRDVKWFSDLYLYSFQENRWSLVSTKAYAPMPRPRSGFQMSLHPTEDILYIYGGYSKEKQVSANPSSSSNKKEAKIHDDMWCVNLKQLLASENQGGKSGSADAALVQSSTELLRNKANQKHSNSGGVNSNSGSGGGSAGRVRYTANWQKVSKKGQFPSARSGASMYTYKNKGLVFGGVYDEEGTGHSLTSTFFADMYAFDMDRKRWYQLGLKDYTAMQQSIELKKTFKLQQKLEKQRLRELGQSTGSDDEEDDDDDEEEENDGHDEGTAAFLDPANNPNMFGYINEEGNIVYVEMDAEEGVASSTDAATAAVNVEGGDATTTPTTATTGLQSMEVDQVSTNLSSVALTEKSVSMQVDTTMSEDAGSATGDAVALMLPIPGDNANTVAAAPLLNPNQIVVTANQSMIARYFANRTSPCPRINAAIIVRGHTLYVYGGITELGDTEITLDDCWCLDLNKRDKWKQLLFGTMHTLVWKDDNDGCSTLGDDDSDGSDVDSDCSDDDYDEDDDDEDECGENEEGSRVEDMEVDSNAEKTRSNTNVNSLKASKSALPGTTITASTALTGDTLTKTTHKSKSGKSTSGGKSSQISASVRNEINSLREQLNIDDEASTPMAGEPLRAFYSRTMAHWSAIVVAKLIARESSADYVPSEKEVKRDGFKLAEERYNELLPVLSRINELESQQDEGQNQHNNSSSGVSDEREEKKSSKKDKKDKDKDKDSGKEKKKKNK